MPNLPVLDYSFFTETTKKAKYLIDGMRIDDSETADHSYGVNRLTLVLAEQIPYLHQREIACLHWGTILHDIGKIGISSSVLHKREPLTVQEFAVIKNHPVWGYRMARLMDMPEDITDIILYHHERYDGKGYPSGRKGKDSPLLARICTVVDAFHAMRTDRPYRNKLTYDQAFQELEDNRGTQFDPDIVDFILELAPIIKAGDIC